MSPDSIDRGLFVIWENARAVESRILADLASHFAIVGRHEVRWTPSRADRNFHRFYRGQVDPPLGEKFRRQKGAGPFLVVTVRDSSPAYQLRNGVDGPSMVNARMLDAKLEYRSWCPGPMQVHATSSTGEYARDLYLLLGVPADAYDRDGAPEVLESDITGDQGWDDFESLFTALNVSLSYVVLRNFEHLPHDDRVGRHTGVDLLVRDYREAVRILGGVPELGSLPAGGGRFDVMVGGRTVRFAVWPAGAGYLDPRWEQRILRRRTWRGVVPTPSDSDYLDSLAYHAVVQKRIHHADEWPRLSELAERLGRDGWEDLDLPKARANVNAFMRTEGYRFTEPDDVVSVYFNHELAGASHPAMRRKVSHAKRLGRTWAQRIRRPLRLRWASARLKLAGLVKRRGDG